MEQFDILQTLGRGSFGVVRKVRRKADGKTLVVKEMDYGSADEKQKEQIVAEVNILRELRHPFIVRYYDRIVDRRKTRLHILMEYCTTDLARLIRARRLRGEYLDEAFLWNLLCQVVVALEFCHGRVGRGGTRRPIIHRDLKPDNVFLTSDNVVKLGDFGLAKELSGAQLAETSVGTPYYMSPELINEQRYDERTDVWSLGCLMYEAAALSRPFNAHNQLSLAMKINTGRVAPLPSRYSSELFATIEWMLNKARHKRPRMEDLVKVPGLQAPLRENRLVVREFQFQQSYVHRTRELKCREAEVSRREAELSASEVALCNRADALAALEKKEEDKKKQQQQQQRGCYRSPEAVAACYGSPETVGTCYGSPETVDAGHRRRGGGDGGGGGGGANGEEQRTQRPQHQQLQLRPQQLQLQQQQRVLEEEEQQRQRVLRHREEQQHQRRNARLARKYSRSSLGNEEEGAAVEEREGEGGPGSAETGGRRQPRRMKSEERGVEVLVERQVASAAVEGGGARKRGGRAGAGGKAGAKADDSSGLGEYASPRSDRSELRQNVADATTAVLDYASIVLHSSPRHRPDAFDNDDVGVVNATCRRFSRGGAGGAGPEYVARRYTTSTSDTSGTGSGGGGSGKGGSSGGDGGGGGGICTGGGGSGSGSGSGRGSGSGGGGGGGGGGRTGRGGGSPPRLDDTLPLDSDGAAAAALLVLRKPRHGVASPSSPPAATTTAAAARGTGVGGVKGSRAATWEGGDGELHLRKAEAVAAAGRRARESYTGFMETLAAARDLGTWAPGRAARDNNNKENIYYPRAGVGAGVGGGGGVDAETPPSRPYPSGPGPLTDLLDGGCGGCGGGGDGRGYARHTPPLAKKESRTHARRQYQRSLSDGPACGFGTTGGAVVAAVAAAAVAAAAGPSRRAGRRGAAAATDEVATAAAAVAMARARRGRIPGLARY